MASSADEAASPEALRVQPLGENDTPKSTSPKTTIYYRKAEKRTTNPEQKKSRFSLRKMVGAMLIASAIGLMVLGSTLIEHFGRSAPSPQETSTPGDPNPLPKPPKPTPSQDQEKKTPPTQSEPVRDLEKYYRLISNDQFSEAYKLRSNDSHGKTSYQTFTSTWKKNLSVSPRRLWVDSRKSTRALVKGDINFTEESADGVAEVHKYRVAVKLVWENGGWKYDGGHFEKSRDFVIDQEGVGPVLLGRSFPRGAYDALGPATTSTPPDDSLDSGSLYWENRLLVKLNDGIAKNNVYGIFVMDPVYTTWRGIGVGSSEDEFQRKYPSARREGGGDFSAGLEFKANGIRFYLYEGRVTEISLSRSR